MSHHYTVSAVTNTMKKSKYSGDKSIDLPEKHARNTTTTIIERSVAE